MTFSGPAGGWIEEWRRRTARTRDQLGIKLSRLQINRTDLLDNRVFFSSAEKKRQRRDHVIVCMCQRSGRTDGDEEIRCRCRRRRPRLLWSLNCFDLYWPVNVEQLIFMYLPIAHTKLCPLDRLLFCGASQCTLIHTRTKVYSVCRGIVPCAFLQGYVCGM